MARSVELARRPGDLLRGIRPFGRPSHSPLPEASRFLRAVSTETIQQRASEENPEDLVYMFELLMTYESPAFDELETVPLFDGAMSQTQTAVPGS